MARAVRRDAAKLFAVHARAGALGQSLENPGSLGLVERRHPVMGAAGHVALSATTGLVAPVARRFCIAGVVAATVLAVSA